MFTFPEWKWTVVCMTFNKKDIRAVQFGRAMKYYQMMGINIVNYDTLELLDKGQKLTEEEESQWLAKLKVFPVNPDIVFTHNSKGDYNAPQHISVNKIVHKLYSNVWEFICPGSVKVAPQPFKKKIMVIPLSRGALDRKTEIFNRSYTSELLCWKNMPGVMIYEFRSGPEMFTQ